MKNKLLALLAILVILISTTGSKTAYAVTDTAGDVDNIIGGILAFCNILPNGHSIHSEKEIENAVFTKLSEECDSSQMKILCLRQLTYDVTFEKYGIAFQDHLIEAEKTAPIQNAVLRQKNALTLIACGVSPLYDSLISIPDETIGKLGIMSYIFGLHLLNNGAKSNLWTAATLADTLISLRTPNGGWAVYGAYPDTDVTAMALQALAPYYNNDNPVIKTVIDESITLLSEKQNANGTFSSYGVENAESVSQVIIALSALNINPRFDQRFIKDGRNLLDVLEDFRLPDGSFCHRLDQPVSNALATEQALQAFVAYRLFYYGEGNFYIFKERVAPILPSPWPSPTSEPSTTSAPSPTSVSRPENSLTPTENFEAITPTVAETLVSPSENVPTQALLTTVPERNPSSGRNSNLKATAFSIIGIATLCTCLIMWLRGRRKSGNYLLVLGIATILCFIVAFAKISTKEDYYNGKETEKDNIIGTVTLSIKCDTIVGKDDNPHIPPNGIILDNAPFYIRQGDTVYTILTEAAREYNIQMDNRGNGGDSSVYIAGINYLYEFQYGDLSGWMYFVNGTAPDRGAGSYMLSDGDKIEWLYTTNLGEDLK